MTACDEPWDPRNASDFVFTLNLALESPKNGGPFASSQLGIVLAELTLRAQLLHIAKPPGVTSPEVETANKLPGDKP